MPDALRLVSRINADDCAHTVGMKRKATKNDPFGSYTGVSRDGDLPEQDADDL